MYLKHPFTCLIAGPTGCGKTSLVKSILSDKIIKPAPTRVVWLYAEDQPLYKSFGQNVCFFKGIPKDFETYFDGKEPSLVVIDDLMTELHSDERLTRLFSVGSHHKNLSVIFIIHNLFHQGKEMRNLSLNSHYIVLFKNPRDKLQVSTLARQMYPGNAKFLTEAFQDATKDSFGYLILDLKPDTEDRFRVRTGILPSDVPIVYMPVAD